MATVLLKGEHQELFSGVLFKCGGKVKSWNKRFFILKSDGCLYYYKDTTKGALGVIPLKDPKFEARKGEAGDVTWPKQTKLDCTMAIVTSHRTFCAYSMYSHEIEEWIRMLTDAREKVVAEVIPKNRLLSGGRSASSSQVKQSKQDKLAGDKARPLSTGGEVQPVNSGPMYDAPGPVSGEAVNEPQEPEALYALASQEEPEEQVLYEDVLIPEKAMYEEMSPQHDPAAGQAPTRSVSQPLYADIAAVDIVQPLYEDIPPQHSSASYVTEEEQTQSSHSDNAPPSLPPRPDMPLLPPRPEMSPPLPAKDDSENSHNAKSSPPSHPTQNPVTSSQAHPPTPPIYDTPAPMLAEATPPGGPPSTDEETTLTPDAKAEQKKLSPVARRRSFSPQMQQAVQSQQPVAKPRSHHDHHTDATECPDEAEQGMLLFRLQKQRIEESRVEKRRAQTLMAEVTADPKLSLSKKTVFAETLREVEQEKLLANEERLRWERERKKLEEERKQFEEEKKRLKEEIQQTRLQLQT